MAKAQPVPPDDIEAAREADLNSAAAKLAGHSVFTVNQMAREEKIGAAGRAMMLANMAETHRRAGLAISRLAMMATLKAAGGEG